MTDGRDPFAPIDDSSVLEYTAKPNNEHQECVVTPIPQNAERVGAAARRLMGRQPDDFWHYHNANGELVFVVVGRCRKAKACLSPARRSPVGVA